MAPTVCPATLPFMFRLAIIEASVQIIERCFRRRCLRCDWSRRVVAEFVESMQRMRRPLSAPSLCVSAILRPDGLRHCLMWLIRVAPIPAGKRRKIRRWCLLRFLPDVLLKGTVKKPQGAQRSRKRTNQSVTISSN